MIQFIRATNDQLRRPNVELFVRLVDDDGLGSRIDDAAAKWSKWRPSTRNRTRRRSAITVPFAPAELQVIVSNQGNARVTDGMINIDIEKSRATLRWASSGKLPEAWVDRSSHIVPGEEDTPIWVLGDERSFTPGNSVVYAVRVIPTRPGICHMLATLEGEPNHQRETNVTIEFTFTDPGGELDDLAHWLIDDGLVEDWESARDLAAELRG